MEFEAYLALSKFSFIQYKLQYTNLYINIYVNTCNCPCVGIRSVIYYACLNTIKYYTVQVTNLYTDASDSQDNHTEV